MNRHSDRHVIELAVAAQAADAEMCRGRDWQERQESARAFLAGMRPYRECMDRRLVRPPSQHADPYPPHRGLGDSYIALAPRRFRRLRMPT
jgi:hypothetical protein